MQGGGWCICCATSDVDTLASQHWSCILHLLVSVPQELRLSTHSSRIFHDLFSSFLLAGFPGPGDTVTLPSIPTPVYL